MHAHINWGLHNANHIRGAVSKRMHGILDALTHVDQLSRDAHPHPTQLSRPYSLNFSLTLRDISTGPVGRGLVNNLSYFSSDFICSSSCSLLEFLYFRIFLCGDCYSPGQIRTRWSSARCRRRVWPEIKSWNWGFHLAGLMSNPTHEGSLGHICIRGSVPLTKGQLYE